MATVREITKKSLDDFLRDTSIGSRRRSVSNNLIGISHRKTRPSLPANKDLYGYLFMVRPQLNLSSLNIRADRSLSNLVTNRKKSIQSWVRGMLDPRLAETGALITPLVDNNNAFIPAVTNNVTSVSGWPDIVSPTFTSKDGNYKEQYSMVDGSVKIYESFDIDLTIANSIGDPLIMLFYTWVLYQSLVFEGIMHPYVDFIKENEIDYNTRLYRLVTDKTGKFVTKIAATGASFPISTPMGQFFDYNKQDPYNNATNEFNIRIRSLGASYNDPILIREFNETVKIFNPGMRDSFRPSLMGKIPDKYLEFFNYKGYPFINEETNELEWYIDRQTLIDVGAL